MMTGIEEWLFGMRDALNKHFVIIAAGIVGVKSVMGMSVCVSLSW